MSLLKITDIRTAFRWHLVAIPNMLSWWKSLKSLQLLSFYLRQLGNKGCYKGGALSYEFLWKTLPLGDVFTCFLLSNTFISNTSLKYSLREKEIADYCNSMVVSYEKNYLIQNSVLKSFLPGKTKFRKISLLIQLESKKILLIKKRVM